MSRWIMSFLVAAFAVGNAVAANGPAATRRAAYRAASQLPAGLPRAHYRFKTTVTRATPPYGRPVYVEDEPEVLFTPTDGYIPYFPPVVGAPLLPGSWALPGHYGQAFSYDYQGLYYGGPNSYVGPYYYPDSYTPYWDRLPYACGVYGYC
jgi:hypothetical protein